MLRSYDQCDKINDKILKKIFTKLRSVKDEFNVLDLSDFINIYLKHKF